MKRGGSAGSTGRQLAAARAALTAWLARPLTSLHLVLATFGLLTLFGLVMVLSASSVQSFTQDGSSYAVFTSQLVSCLAGLLMFWVALRLPVRWLRATSFAFLLGCVALLVLVLTPLGVESQGAQSWLRLGPASLQPAEPAKLALAMWGAQVLVAKRALLGQWRHLLVPLVPVAVLIFALVMLQPDMGTTMILAIVLLALLWFAGAPAELFGAIVVAAVAGAVTMAAVAGYRSARIESFLNPTADPQGVAFQARQALYSLAEGGWWGVGLGQGSAKWDYLPNAHNDFIFAIVGEELGFLGCLVVLLLFATVAYTGMRIAARNTDPWIKLVAATITAWLVGQAAINIGYVVGLLPVTGLQLPMISSGGTSLALTMFSFGLLANFARHEPQAVTALRSDLAPRGGGPAGGGRLVRLLRLRPPEPYQPSRRPAGVRRPPPPAARPRARRPSPASMRGGAGR
ncbi:MAG: putative lipid II flippase FtsW [Pseudonocardiaceae bacterium]|nr:putative lipid II flippase FtsW [Pseudonocardiaceae bacterium]